MAPSPLGKFCAVVCVTAVVLSLQFSLVSARDCPGFSDLRKNLRPNLSSSSVINNVTVNASRWSQYAAPNPAFVVNVAAESDVAVIVRYCNEHNVSFLLQSQGNGWANTFHLGQCGLLIDISDLDRISFNAQKTEAMIQGGTLVRDMVVAAYDNETRFANPTCECLGFLGTSLGGGLTRTMGLYGTLVDQLLSLNVVTALGEELLVDANHHPDLWYALRGAAPNFGIVTSAVIKAYPTPKAENVAWQGQLVFPDQKLEELVQVIQDMDLDSHMQVDLLIANSGPPAYVPTITAIPLFLGNASAAQVAFEPILRLGPNPNNAREIPYTDWGRFSDSFCQEGGRKPVYGVSLARTGFDPETWRTVYTAYGSFVSSHPEAGNSSILAEYYPVGTAVAYRDADATSTPSSSYPFREVPIHVAIIPWYSESSMDGEANAWGSSVRDSLRGVDGLAENSTYINFAHGDEPSRTVYGESLPRLQGLKRQYDPENRFDQWFPLM